MVGTTVGDRYLLIERIGHGGSGTLYRAEHVTLRRKVAVKVLHHELSRDDLAIERFRREATTVGEIRNEHIVEIHDFGRTGDGRLYLAMELLQGETLSDLLEREGQLVVDGAVDILVQVGEALMEAHAMGYVHRDLRPRNIFLATRRGRQSFIKLLDFGLAKLVEKEGDAASTSLGMTFGDPHYMSPEQARGDSIDRRADIYSLGCIAYQMLIGEPPFVGGKVFDILTRHVENPPVDPVMRRADIPPWLGQAILRMLAKRPDERFITVYRVIEALREGQGSGAIMTDEVARRPETAPPPSVSQAMARLGARAPEETAPVAPVAGGAPLAPVASDEEATTEPNPAPVARESSGPAMAMVALQVPRHPLGGEGGRTAMGIGRAGNPPRPAAAPADSGRGDPTRAEPSDASASGKRGRTSAPPPGSPASSSGISAAWFADGDAFEGLEALDERARRKLDRARLAPSETGLMGQDALRYESRKRWWLAGAVVGGVVLLALVAVAMMGGDRDNKPAAAPPDAGSAVITAGATAPPAADPPEVLADAGAPEVDRLATPPEAVETGTSGSRTGSTSKSGSGKSSSGTSSGKSSSSGTSSGKSSSGTSSGKSSSGTSSGKSGSATGAFDHIGTSSSGAGSASGADSASGSSSASGSGTASGSEDKAKADFYAKLGERDLGNSDFLGAATHFNKARELDANNATAIMGLGEIALSQGSASAAIAHLKKATKLRPKSSRAHTLLGEAYLAAGTKQSAAASFKRALQVDPDNARAREGYNEAAGVHEVQPGDGSELE
jgi:serine/threonine-protein kinase